MPKRAFWTVVGYGAGVASTVMVKRKVRRTVNRYAPSEMRHAVTARSADVVDRAKRVTTELRAAADEGIRAMRDRRRELDDEFAPAVDVRASDVDLRDVESRDLRRSPRVGRR
jgi:hypothetical protein